MPPAPQRPPARPQPDLVARSAGQRSPNGAASQNSLLHALFGRSRTFASFSEPAFAWFFVSTLGQMGAAIMQIFVRSFLVFELTDSYFALGVVAIGSALPQLLLGPYGGVVADRFPKKTVTQVFQIIGLANTLTIGTLAVLGVLDFWHLIVSAVFQGVLVAMMVPARQSMVSEIVSRERLMNGVSLAAAAMNIMQFVGPGLGGLLLYSIGAGGTFYVMAAGYLIAIVTMFKVPRVPAQATGGVGGPREALTDMAAGFRYMAGHRTLRMILLLSFVVSALGMPFQPMLPGFVQDVFGADAALAGAFGMVSAAGALLASLRLAGMAQRRRGWLLLGLSALLGLGVLGIAVSSWLWLSLALMIVLGVGQSGRMSVSATLIQEHAEPAFRGRAMSVLMMQFSLMSLGAFVLGLLAEGIGIRWAVAGMAIGLLAATAATAALSPRIRSVQ